MTVPLLSLPALRRGLSSERISAYSLADDRDSTDALARYIWNGYLCASFQPSLHALELTLRNALFSASENAVDVTGRVYGSVRCWLDLSPSLLEPREQDAVTKAKARLGSNLRKHTPARLVAKLSFGFWTALLQRPYEQGNRGGPRLWPRLTTTVFPFAPKSMRARALLSTHLDAVREFRNRIAHHEPIWDRDPLEQHSRILEAIGWMHPGMRKAAQVLGDPTLLFHQGPGAFRSVAARILGADV